jgi:hypothetical protein
MTWQDATPVTDRLHSLIDKWDTKASRLEDLLCCAGEWRNQEAKTTAETLQFCSRALRKEIAGMPYTEPEPDFTDYDDNSEPTEYQWRSGQEALEQFRRDRDADLSWRMD